MSRAFERGAILVVAQIGASCATSAGPTSATQPASTVSVVPSAAAVAAVPSAPSSATGPTASSPPPRIAPTASAATAPAAACRGERLMLQDVVASCRTEEPETGIPKGVVLELSGPAVVDGGASVTFELGYVNRTSEVLSFVVAVTCSSEIEASDAKGRSAITYESSHGDVAFSCSAKARRVRVELAASGGALVEPLTWSAHRERHRDGTRLSKAPLDPGSYTVTARSWFPPETTQKNHLGHGIHETLIAKTSVRVR